MSISRLRTSYIKDLLTDFPAVCVVGPRQCGKTTLIKQLSGDGLDLVYLDMESPRDVIKLKEAELFFELNTGKRILIDEIQRRPDLFPVMRSIIDRDRRPGRLLLTGSASPELLRQGSETLAGRLAIVELSPFNWTEVKSQKTIQDVWMQGGFPDSLMAKNPASAQRWRQNFVRTYIDRELPLLGLSTDQIKLSRFVSILASRQGQIVNKEELGRSAGLSADTVNRYFYYLEQSFLLRRLAPFHTNVGKRLVKAPKYFFRDSGLLHTICAIDDLNDLLGNALAGGSWEGFVIEQIGQLLPENIETAFYRTHQGAEADLVLLKNQKPFATMEIKLTTAPSLRKGFITAIQDLKTTKNFIVTPGNDHFPLGHGVEAIGIEALLDKLFSGTF